MSSHLGNATRLGLLNLQQHMLTKACGQFESATQQSWPHLNLVSQWMHGWWGSRWEWVERDSVVDLHCTWSVALCINGRQVYLFSTETLLPSTTLAASESHPSQHLNMQWNPLPTSSGINNSTLVSGWDQSQRDKKQREKRKETVGSTAKVISFWVDYTDVCLKKRKKTLIEENKLSLRKLKNQEPIFLNV